VTTRYASGATVTMTEANQENDMTMMDKADAIDELVDKIQALDDELIHNTTAPLLVFDAQPEGDRGRLYVGLTFRCESSDMGECGAAVMRFWNEHIGDDAFSFDLSMKQARELYALMSKWGFGK